MDINNALIASSLVTTAKNIPENDPGMLITMENELAKHYHYNIFYKMDEDIEHYLFMTSLPYMFDTAIDFDLREVWHPQCRECLSERIQDRLFVPTGNLRPYIMVIGDAPGESGGKGDEYTCDINRLWNNPWKKSSYYTRAALRVLGLHHKAWYTNLIKPSIKGNEPSTKEEVDVCSRHLIKEVLFLHPQVILALGNHVSEMLLPAKTVKVFHPAYVARQGWSVAQYALHISERFVKNGIVLPT